ncbi:MAG: nucleoside-diphosphate kinase [Blastocatellia bacterium]|nr:nucleoside-diphosphate kinase [Blastocatellia bacterium]MCS7158467.1 nucleoside-diphosphate kinase [Blastocatellia bacterium]MCX7753462.1 nucleoside-diphosphate kinase [Blastocatellia bacterium]MDW8167852.1 nucleoside-diphosphate kinase [Acidobacteriota bacterium]MDW8255887.1 nucleoside-diphosphate kinase [Acidobacteriota bacterium]
MLERTLAIIKPDAVERGLVGEIIRRIEAERFRIRGLKMVHLTKAQAEGFYAVHRDKPFFESLTTFMSSGPCVVLLLEGESAISRWREVMGATDPARAADGTIRRQFGTTIERNVVHGSDAPETAEFEIAYFFNALEIVG